MTNFNCPCPAIQRGQGSGFLSEGSSGFTACMSEQRRFWRDCVDAKFAWRGPFIPWIQNFASLCTFCCFFLNSWILRTKCLRPDYALKWVWILHLIWVPPTPHSPPPPPTPHTHKKSLLLQNILTTLFCEICHIFWWQSPKFLKKGESEIEICMKVDVIQGKVWRHTRRGDILALKTQKYM